VVRLLLAAVLLIVLGGLTVRFTNGRLLGPASDPGNPGGTAPISAAAPAAAPTQVTYELAEAALTDQVNQRLASQQIGSTPLGPATLRRLTLHLRGGRILADGDAQVAGTVLPVSLAGSLAAQAGHPVVTLQEATVAGVAVPDETRALMERTMQGQVESALAQQRLSLTSVTIQEGKIVAVGTRT